MLNTKPHFKTQYENYIGGQWTAPINGKYFDNHSPVDGSLIAKMPRSDSQDIDLAIEAAGKAADSWGKTSVAERCQILNKIADRLEANLQLLATIETWDNGKAIRETVNADMPLAIDHFRYFAAAIRTEAGEVSDLDASTVSMEVHEPLGVVGQIIPWNFPILMATWKIAPALAAGNCVVLKPAEQTPTSIMCVIELIEDLLPPGVLNVVNGFGLEAGKPLAAHPDIQKIAFTGETCTGTQIMKAAAENITPITLELGGKSPNLFFESVMAHNDEFFDKAIEGLVMFALNQGEVCTCPSRALIQESIYDEFMARCLKRIEAIQMGDPLNPETMMGALTSSEQFEKIMNYIAIGKNEGAELLTGGEVFKSEVHPNGYYIQPTVFKGHNKMRIFQEEIFGPVLAVTTFKDEAEAIEIANDTSYGLGAGVWTRDLHQMQSASRAIQAGRIWCNNYHSYPANASFGGYKKSGIGRETHRMMLNQYRHTKNILTSYDKNALGFF
ncbi:MAG: aldehyde dehydrogenase [Alteromonadaceae bacterium]|nr:MAG: aldehyde dehydrogenase [Alteromonadaceae bacterium]